MWDINYPYADNLYPKWDIWGPTLDVSSHPMWDPKHPTLDTNYLHTDNIKAVLRFQLNIPCGMLIISMRRFCVLSKAEKRKIFKMADILLGKCSKTVIENPQKSIKGIKEI